MNTSTANESLDARTGRKLIRVLLIEDNPADALIMREMLASVTDISFEVQCASTLSSGLKCLSQAPVHVILLDLSLPDGRGINTFLRFRENAADAPVLVLTGVDDENIAIQAMKEGAQDYLVKGTVDSNLISRAIRYAIERHQLLANLGQSIRDAHAREENFRNAIARNADGMIVLDPDRKVIFVNPAAESLFKRRAEDMVGQALDFPLVVGKTLELSVDQPQDSPLITEMRLVDVEWQGRPAYLASVHDITERKKLAETLTAQALELERSNEKLKELDQMKSEFISVVSHELRTPLTSLRAAAGLIQDGALGNLNEEQKEYMELVHRNLDRLEEMVNDVLSISRIESGRLQLDLVETDVRSLIKEVVQTLSLQAREKQSSLATDISEGARFVRCDAEKIIQVLLNLTSNALRHNPGGTGISVGARREGQGIRIWVRDNGIGIPVEEQSKIFERFYQIRRKAGSGSQGTGLGLAISKGLVEAHGSKLCLTSEPGKGTTFYFDLEAVEIKSWELSRRDSWPLPGLTVTAEQYGDRVRLLLSGRVVETNVSRLAKISQEILATWGHLVVMDLSVCDYMDSRGIGHLVEVRAKALERGGDMALVGLSSKLETILQSVGILNVIPCHSDLSVALASMRKEDKKPNLQTA